MQEWPEDSRCVLRSAESRYELISRNLRGLSSSERGQSTVEYALIMVFIVVGLGASLGALGGSLDSFFGEVAAAVDALLP